MGKTEMLKDYLKNSGKTKTFIAKRMNASRPRLDYIIEHPETATHFQAIVLINELIIPDRDSEYIFLP